MLKDLVLLGFELGVLICKACTQPFVTSLALYNFLKNNSNWDKKDSTVGKMHAFGPAYVQSLASHIIPQALQE